MTTGESSFDIAYVADFGSKAVDWPALAEEVRAQAAAGYATGFVPLSGRPPAEGRAVDPAILACVRDGAADVVRIAGARVRATLAVLPDPQALVPAPRAAVSFRAEQALIPVKVSLLSADGALALPVRQVDDAAAAIAGGPVAWAPYSREIRQQIAQASSRAAILARDWTHVVGADQWRGRPDPARQPAPVLGRCAAQARGAWPGDLRGLLAYFPVSRHVLVRLLGLPPDLLTRLGGRPRSWTLFSAGTVAPARFLRGLDFFVVPTGEPPVRLVEHAALQAMAAGVIGVLPGCHAAALEDGAIYPRDRAELLEMVLTLHRSPADAGAQARRGRDVALQGFGPRVHAARLGDLIGPPMRAAPSRQAARARPGARTGRSGRTLLLVSSNGIGLGHLTRLLAIAKRLPSGIRPVFVTMSQAVALLRAAGFHAEHLPFHTYPECDVGHWNRWLREELTHMLRYFGASAAVFDGQFPYGGLVEAIAGQPAVKGVWCRRAMWRRVLWSDAIERSAFFDLVIEPGELAQERDIGATVPYRNEVVPVEPITLLDESDLLDRAEARRQLGLDPGRTVALIQLSSGNHLAIVPVIDRILEELRRYEHVQPVIAEWVMANRPLDHWREVRRLVDFPNARYFRAFDFVVSAAGYNSFHELIRFGVPTIFIPVDLSFLDNQPARAAYAAEEALALSIGMDDLGRLPEAIARMVDPATRARLARACAARRTGNGAEAAALRIAGLVA